MCKSFARTLWRSPPAEGFARSWRQGRCRLGRRLLLRYKSERPFKRRASENMCSISESIDNNLASFQ